MSVAIVIDQLNIMFGKQFFLKAFRAFLLYLYVHFGHRLEDRKNDFHVGFNTRQHVHVNGKVDHELVMEDELGKSVRCAFPSCVYIQ